jgi:glycine/D-amino acid oxidase-like deaminating enzyme
VIAPSYWWASLGGMPPARAPLPGTMEVDVAIVGAGYTGLWTAWYLLEADPSLRVVLLERERTGFGASGRNGGWLSGLWPGGADPATQEAINATIDVVASWCVEQGVDCDLVKGGTLEVALTAPSLRRLQETLAGHGDQGWVGLSPVELRDRVVVPGALGALWSPHCARIHPAKLVRGLAAAVESRGATIFENTAVTEIRPGSDPVRPVAITPRGDVRARWVIRATEGYTAGLAGLRRTLVPMNSAMIVTEPVDGIGWDGGETMLDAAHAYCYLQHTADGRIAIGGRGVPYRFGSATDRGGEIAPQTVGELRARLVRLFPSLKDVRIDHAWAGVLGVARDWRPAVCADRPSGVAWAGGYVGDGVSTTNLAGRTLRDLLLGADSELTRLPWVGHPWRRWEPEPLRWLGIHSVYGLYRRADHEEERSGRPSRLARVADRVAGR